MHLPSTHPHVIIAGGGVAAVECALALRDLAGDRIRLTIVAPNREFALRPLCTAEPFARDHVRHHSLATLAARVGADLVAAPVTKVHPDQHRVVAGDRTIGYDVLVLAVGGQHRPAFTRAITFTGDTRAVDYHGLLQDIDEGYTHAVSFVVPPGTTWPLPLYELALMTAREASGMGVDDVRMQIVSPEASPLALFGRRASDAIADLLDKAGVSFRPNAYVRETEAHRLEIVPGGEELQSQRVVALPTIEGVRIEGVPADDHGFIPVDDQLRVVGLVDVFAAGDGTAFPVKQGGIACQQADAIAELLAAAAGAAVEPQPFRPVLRGRVLAGRGAEYLEHALHGGAGHGPPAELRLWSAAHKVEGRYLSPWLEELDDAPAGASAAPAAAPAEGDVVVDVPLGLDPYSPVPQR
jgi:sulfide:quinone oxidoreductase